MPAEHDEPTLLPAPGRPRARGTRPGVPWALVVATSPALRAWLTSRLHRELVVRDATCGTEGIALLEPLPPDLVVADISTLDVVAIEFLWRLRRLAPRALRVLVVAPGTTAARDVAAFREPGDFILERPLAVDTLAATLRDACTHVLARAHPGELAQVPPAVIERARKLDRDVACWLVDLSRAVPPGCTPETLATVHDVVLHTARRVLALLLSEPAPILHDTRRDTLRVLVLAHDRPSDQHLARWSQELRLRLDLALLELVTGAPAHLPQTRVAVHVVRARAS